MKGDSMGNQKYSKELKTRAVEEYLSGGRMMDVVRKYELSSKSVLKDWKEKYLEHGEITDGRLGCKHHRKKNGTDSTNMSQEEYIRSLEMENAILKRLCSLSNSQPDESIR